MKLWGGRFKQATHELVEAFNASIDFDKTLAPFDIQGSLAHVKMLGKCQILPMKSVEVISTGLQTLAKQLEESELSFSVSDEDIHMNIERKLFELIGEEAGKLHTGRSRNDQVALDLHLYLRHHTLGIVNYLCELQQVLLSLAAEHIAVLMPGYTHLQRAEPIRFSQHMLAYYNMFQRDIERLIDGYKRINQCPLGAGALAGSGVAVDRNYVADLLHFDDIYQNSLDAVSDRDFVAEFIFAASLIMMHISKFSEEIILWCSQEFSFIQLSDQFCTGSSMMPQKKNPDVAELARGKTGRVYGSLMAILTVLKGLPLAYNKDLQEDKEGLFDTVKTLQDTLAVFTPMLASMQVNRDNLNRAVTNDYSNATQLANYLVETGLPFRQAHEITGNIVLDCIEQKCLLMDVNLERYQNYHPAIEADIFQWLDFENVVEAHAAVGGTSKATVKQQLEVAHKKWNINSNWLQEKLEKLENE